MRNYRKVVAALVLALVFAAPAFADDGVMYTDKTQPPPPTNSQTVAADGIMVTDKTQTAGIIYTDKTQSASGVAESATQVALSLLQSALTLL